MKINESEATVLIEVDISTLSPDEAEYGRSSSMIKGVAAGLKEKAMKSADLTLVRQATL